MSDGPVTLRKTITAAHHDDEALAVVAWHEAVRRAFSFVHESQPPYVEWQYPWGFVATGEATGEVYPHG